MNQYSAIWEAQMRYRDMVETAARLGREEQQRQSLRPVRSIPAFVRLLWWRRKSQQDVRSTQSIPKFA